MQQQHKELFAEIDRIWPLRAETKVRLSVIGSGALMLQADYERGTKDSDVFETTGLSSEIKEHLSRVAGAGSDLHRRWKLYIDIVANGVPFLPHVPIWHPVVALNRTSQHIELFALDIVDVVVSKLKRFHANDQADIDAMVERNLVSHGRLIERFCAAADEFSGDARASELPKYIKHLHRVERDMLGVPETEIELPPWI